jgi:Glutamine cyclotransferase
MDADLNVLRRQRVTKDGKPVYDLNELEYIDGKVWANVYTTDTIVIINPADGVVRRPWTAGACSLTRNGTAIRTC